MKHTKDCCCERCLHKVLYQPYEYRWLTWFPIGKVFNCPREAAYYGASHAIGRIKVVSLVYRTATGCYEPQL